MDSKLPRPDENSAALDLDNRDDDVAPSNDEDVLSNEVLLGGVAQIEEKEQMSNIPSLVVALCSSLTTGGTTYSFGLYGATLQKTLHLSQGQVDTISTAFFFAGLFSFLPGLCSDRFGARIALITGGCLGCTNLLLYWCVAREYIIIPHSMIVAVLSVLGIGTFLSSALVTGAVFKTLSLACQRGSNRGTAIGIAKGYVGLGSGLYVAIFEASKAPGETKLDFLPMAAFFCIVVVAIPAALFLPTNDQISGTVFRDDATPLHFRMLYASLIVMATLIVGSSVKELFVEPLGIEVQEFLSDEPMELRKHDDDHIGMAIMLVCIWLLPIYSFFILPRKVYDLIPDQSSDSPPGDGDAGEENNSNTDAPVRTNTDAPVRRASQNADDEDIGLLESSDHQDVGAFDDDLGAVDTPPHPEQTVSTRDTGRVLDKGLFQMLLTPAALLMLWTTTILVGAGTLESNNMSQMVDSLGFPQEVTPASVALFSVAQCAARVITGAMSESAQHWRSVKFCVGQQVRGVPRPFFLVLASFVALLAHLTLGSATTQTWFVIGATISGAAFGMVWPLMVLIVGEIFGSNNIGGNYMFFDGFTSAAGTFLLSKVVAQDVYEAHVLPPNHDPDGSGGGADDSGDCYGPGCFQMTHWIVAGLTVSCIFSSIVMQYITRDIYRAKLLTAQLHDHTH